MGYGGKGLNKYEAANKRNIGFFKGSVQHKVRNIILFLCAVGLFISVVNPYLRLLGTQKSQSSEASKKLFFKFPISNLDEILPVHQFMLFSKDDLAAKMACNLKNDPAECHNAEERRCISKGINTFAYHNCIVKLLKTEGGNPVKFCKDHYGNMQLWTGENAPDKSMYYRKKYGCLKSAGIKYGADYCRAINKYTPKATTLDLFKCYRKYSIDYSEEQCDYDNRGDDAGLLKCYESKEVPRNAKFCEVTEKDNLKGLIDCYDKAEISSIRLCDLKYDNDKKNNKKTESQASKTAQGCYKDLGFTLDVQFCDDNYRTTDDKYACYARVGFTNFTEDRVYCERKYRSNADAKY